MARGKVKTFEQKINEAEDKVRKAEEKITAAKEAYEIAKKELDELIKAQKAEEVSKLYDAVNDLGIDTDEDIKFLKENYKKDE